MNLNEFQRRAVYHKNGPVLVLAGPGSGKTTVIMNRIKYLTTRYKVNPSRILAVTFSKSACEDMKHRYEKDIEGKYCNVSFMTIHALCYEMICWRKQISQLNIDKEEDFEGLILDAYEILSTEKESLNHWQKRFEQIIVDEFQDTSQLQAKILFLLAEKHRNIMVVGDDDQSIYGFRGSTPKIFEDFKEYFKETETISLQINYRCREEIVIASQQLIKHNKKRLEKETMFSCQELHNNDVEEPVAFKEYPSQWEEMRGIIAEIKRLHLQGIPYEEIGVLFRNRYQFRLFLLFCKTNDVPVNSIEAKWGQHYRIMEDIYSYLKVLTYKGNRADYLKIMNKPERKLTREYLEHHDVCESEWIQKGNAQDVLEGKRMKAFIDELNFLRNLSPFLGICHLYNKTGYVQYAKNYMVNREDEPEIADELLKWVLNEAKKVKSYEELYQVLQVSEANNVDGINVLTMHASKGLEYERVFLPELNVDVLPNKKAVHTSEVEEERRLLYVAITRAREKVYLSWVSEKKNNRIDPSPFIAELIV